MSDTEVDLDKVLNDDEDIRALEKLNTVLDSDDSDDSDVALRYTSAPNLQKNLAKYERRSKIDAALALNKMCDEKMQRLEKLLYSRLRECREKLKEIQTPGASDNSEKVEKFRYVMCGRPYFKDSASFPAPDNEDTILMQRTGMYDFSQMTSVSGWTVRDKSNFLKLMLKMSQDLKKKKMQSKIYALRRRCKNKTKPINDVDTQIEIIQIEIAKINTLTLKEVALPINEDYDWYAIANKLNKRHMAVEYQSLWKLFLHPSINKSAWSKAEHVSLQKIACEEKLQDWDKIAVRLDTGRTNYQCFVYFRTNMSNTFTGRKWSTEEIEYLKRLIEYYKEDTYIPWGKVSTSIENRTKIQIYNKYLSMCEQRKGRFVPEEDAVILTCIESFGKNYHKMADHLPGRSAAQCRVRSQVLEKKRISTVWTVEEDKKLIQLMANQDSSINYSSITKYFPDKDRVHIRARYLTLTKWMKRNPTSDVAKAPRRGARRFGHGTMSEDLQKAIESLKHRMQSEVNIVKKKRLTAESSASMIDDAIAACLATERTWREQAKKRAIEHQNSVKLVELSPNNEVNIHVFRKILVLMGATLNKQKFLKSPVSNKYKVLLEPCKTVPAVKFKSYSKKVDVPQFEIETALDVWDGEKLDNLTYVLPPNYASITGCRRLMSYLTTTPKSNDVINFTVLTKKNVLLKDQICILMERFNFLFLWPMLLSNTAPDPFLKFEIEQNQSMILKKERECLRFDKEEQGLALPQNIESDVVNDIIDLDHCPSSPEINAKYDSLEFIKQ